MIFTEEMLDIRDGVLYGFKNGINKNEVTEVSMPKGVTSIRRYVFSDCSNLVDIKIPKSVKSIKEYAFKKCSSLTSITIPEGVKSIGNGAFGNCGNLTSITIPKGVESIGDSAFNTCNSLTIVTIPDSVTSIGYGAFYGCSRLQSITIPEGVKSIGERAFCGCSSLTSVEIPGSVENIGNRAFENCSGLTDIKIPEGVESIGKEAFANCESLTDIEGFSKRASKYLIDNFLSEEIEISNFDVISRKVEAFDKKGLIPIKAVVEMYPEEQIEKFNKKKWIKLAGKDMFKDASDEVKTALAELAIVGGIFDKENPYWADFFKDRNSSNQTTNVKNIKYKITMSNWGMIGPNSITDNEFNIYDDLSIELKVSKNNELGTDKSITTLYGSITHEKYDKIETNIKNAKDINTKVEAFDGDA